MHVKSLIKEVKQNYNFMAICNIQVNENIKSDMIFGQVTSAVLYIFKYVHNYIH